MNGFMMEWYALCIYNLIITTNSDLCFTLAITSHLYSTTIQRDPLAEGHAIDPMTV